MSGEIVSRECYAFGHLFPGSPLKVEAPVEFFDPLTGSLMTEPVRLLNSDSVFDRSSLQKWFRRCAKDVEPRCPLTGVPLKGWITIQAEDKLRKRLVAWAEKHNCNLDLISSLSSSLPKPAAAAGPCLRTFCQHCGRGSGDECLTAKPCRPRARSFSLPRTAVR